LKALFAHGLKFYQTVDGKLYLRGYNQKFWDRYLTHFEKVYVIGRKVKLKKSDLKGYNEFSGDNLVFVEVPEIHGIDEYLSNNSKSNKIIEKTVQYVDCVIARLPGTYSSTAINYSKKYFKPYIIELVGCPWDAYWNHSPKGKLIAPIITKQTKNLVKNSKYTIYVTNEFLQKRYPTKGVKLGCSDVALPNLDEKILEDRLIKINSMRPTDKVVIGTTAAIDVKYKGQEYVIRAISKLCKEGLNIEYHLAGGGDAKYLKAIAEKYNVEDKVMFLGSLPHEKVFEYLKNIDIYIQPSKQEGLPRALVEAMSMACPAIGSETGGIPELINKDFVFSNGAVDNIVYAIKQVLDNNMKDEAIRSFNKAKEYDSDILDEKRSTFYHAFIESEFK